MNKNNWFFVVGAFFLFVGVVSADQAHLSQGASANAARPCNFDGVTAQKVSVSGTTAATATTTGNGVVRMVCTGAAHFAVGASGVSATSGDAYLPAGIPEYIMTGSSKKVAFIQDTASGSCYVSSCQ